MSEFPCHWSIDDFTATAIHTGENRLVRVQGTGTCPTTGYRVTLAVGNPGVVPNAKRLYLQLTEKAPKIGGDALTAVTIDESFDVTEDVSEVEIRRLGVLEVTDPN